MANKKVKIRSSEQIRTQIDALKSRYGYDPVEANSPTIHEDSFYAIIRDMEIELVRAEAHEKVLAEEKAEKQRLEDQKLKLRERSNLLKSKTKLPTLREYMSKVKLDVLTAEDFETVTREAGGLGEEELRLALRTISDDLNDRKEALYRMSRVLDMVTASHNIGGMDKLRELDEGMYFEVVGMIRRFKS